MLNAVLSVLLIHDFGLVGAALATTATLIVWNVAMALFIWWRLKMLPGVLGLPRANGELRRFFEGGRRLNPR